MTEPGNENPRPGAQPWSAPPKPPTVPPWPGPEGSAVRTGGLGRTGWVVLGVGLGCLTPIVLGMVFWMITFFLGRHSEVNSGRHEQNFSFRQMLPPGLAPEAGPSQRSPYAAHVRSWQHNFNGAPAGGDLREFQDRLDNWVFEENGARVQRDAGEVTSFAAATEFASDGTSGVSTVTLSGAGDKKVRLYVSFEQEVGGEWEFKLDMYR